MAAFDNALPHLTSDQLAPAVAAMAARLKPGGLFAASIRDYDHLMPQRPHMQEPALYGAPGTRRIVHQVWDWSPETRYTLHLYITLEVEAGWQTRHFVSEYRCLLRDELSKTLERAGFREVLWLLPAESAFYQPLVLARWP